MSDEKLLYVEIKRAPETEKAFAFEGTGCGWCKKSDFDNSNILNINVRCDDNYDGQRAVLINRKYISKCSYQKSI